MYLSLAVPLARFYTRFIYFDMSLTDPEEREPLWRAATRSEHASSMLCYRSAQMSGDGAPAWSEDLLNSRKIVFLGAGPLRGREPKNGSAGREGAVKSPIAPGLGVLAFIHP